MATMRNPYEPVPDVFKVRHRPGQVTTRHREIEAARANVRKEGVHPFRGQFEYVPPPFDEPQDINLTEYAAADGSKVSIRMLEPSGKISASPARNGHDRFCVVNGRKMSIAAARLYLMDRFGISY